MLICPQPSLMLFNGDHRFDLTALFPNPEGAPVS